MLLMCACLAGCDLLDELLGLSGSTQNAPKLPTPEVEISFDGLAVWSEDENALYYIYVIDDGNEKATAELSVQLEENQTIKVKTISGTTEYSDSDFSAPKTYVKGQEQEQGHSHTDINSDGFCDKCRESVMVELSFYAVNDLHGKFMDTDNQPGVDEFTTYLKNLYADTTREEILLSSGDMWQGTVESSSNKGQLMTDWMNEVGFVSMTLGNHEYDWGPATLTPNSQQADFPFLAINVTYNGRAVDYCRASTVVERGGMKIGIIGAIGNCLSSISGEFSNGLSFATGSALTTLVKNEATRLRSVEGCDFIVYSIHDGGEDFSTSGIEHVTNSQMTWYDSSLSDGYVDLVFEAHTHQRYILQDEYGVYHMQGGGENSYISSAEVSFNYVTKKYSVTPRLIGSYEYASSSIEGDSVVGEIFEKYFPDSNPYTNIVGNISSEKSSYTICEKIAELYYERGRQEWGGQYNIVLGGGYLKTRSPYDLSAGSVTYAQLFSVLPFDNDIILGKISGYYLKSKFLNTTNRTYHYYAPTIDASSVSDSQLYYIVVDSYTAFYGPNNITVVARFGSVNPSNRGKYARDLLADFLQGGGW